ncbi:hypothetical protein EVAR_87601_1 [Eumeta japonica]|uniref:Uncharacterized protein n=1 Tax=Eumeta variegata TaxID=151549 RepID=A0A4C1WL84_EUMVA|nr:hypothetical protein EVAR_87601_1 [Eumeta japonica]
MSPPLRHRATDTALNTIAVSPSLLNESEQSADFYRLLKCFVGSRLAVVQGLACKDMDFKPGSPTSIQLAVNLNPAHALNFDLGTAFDSNFTHVLGSDSSLTLD